MPHACSLLISRVYKASIIGHLHYNDYYGKSIVISSCASLAVAIGAAVAASSDQAPECQHEYKDPLIRLELFT